MGIIVNTLTSEGRKNDFLTLVRQLGSHELKLRASGFRKLKSGIEQDATNLSRCACSSLLCHFFDFGSMRAAKASRQDCLIGIATLRATFRVNLYQAVDARVGTLNMLIDVLEADRASDYNAPCASSAATLLGNIASTSALKPELELLTERYLGPAMDWLVDPRYEIRRYAGALILSQLVSNLPTLVCRKFPLVTERLWSALLDRTHAVREAASLVIAGMFSVLWRQSKINATACMHSISQIISRGLLDSIVTDCQIHASMLLLRIVSRPLCRSPIWASESNYMLAPWCTSVFKDREVGARWSSAVLGLRGLGAKDARVREIAIEIIPYLARFTSKNSFCRVNAVHTVLSTLKSATASRVAYISLGRLVVVVAPSLLHHDGGPLLLRQMIDSLCCVARRKYFNNEILLCLSMLVEACSSAQLMLTEEIKSHSSPGMFDAELTSSVVHGFITLFENLPALRIYLQHCLFDKLMAVASSLQVSACLVDARQNMCIKKGQTHKIVAMSQNRSRFCLTHSMALRLVQKSALRVRSRFYCNEAAVSASSKIIGFIELPDAAVRFETAMFSCQTIHCALSPTGFANFRSKLSLAILLERLMVAASSDPCAQIRSSIISTIPWDLIRSTILTPKLACPLQLFRDTQEISLQAAFLFFDSFRISPHLNKFMIMFLPIFDAMLEKEPLERLPQGLLERPRVISLRQAHFIISEAGCMLANCAPSLMSTVLSMFHDATSRDVAIATTAILGDLFLYAGPEHAVSLEAAIPSMVNLLCNATLMPTTDSGSSNDLAAVRALAQVISSTGAIVTPVCWRNGELFDAMWRQYRLPGFRHDCSAILGSIGAIPPRILDHMRQARSALPGSKMTFAVVQDAEYGPSVYRRTIMSHAQVTSEKTARSHSPIQVAKGRHLSPCTIALRNDTFKQFYVLSLKEHAQIASFESALFVLHGVPEFKKDACKALMQICFSFNKSALPLLFALDVILKILEERCVTDTLAACEMFLHCMTQVVYFAAPAIIMTLCSSSDIAGVLALHWCHMAPRKGGIVALTFALSKKLPRLLFAPILSSILPLALSQLSSCPFQVLRAIDMLIGPIIAGGQVLHVIESFIEHLFASSPRPCGSKCLSVIGAIRIVNRLQSGSISQMVLPSFVLKMLELLNLRTSHMKNHIVESVEDSVVLLEIVLTGFLTCLRHIGLNFVGYMLPINCTLTNLINSFSSVLDGEYRTNTDLPFVYSTVRTSPATRIYGAVIAMADYCSGVCALLGDGRTSSLPTRSVRMLDAEYDTLVLDLARLGVATAERLMMKPIIMADNHTTLLALKGDRLDSPEDWQEWVHHMSVELLRQSTEPHLRACATICEIHQPAAIHLFQVAALTTSHENKDGSSDKHCSSLTASILQGLDLMSHVTTNPMQAELPLMMFDLALFMRAHNKSLPLDFSHIIHKAGNKSARTSWGHLEGTDFRYVAKIQQGSHCFNKNKDEHHCTEPTKSGIIELRCRTADLDFCGALLQAKLLWQSSGVRQSKHAHAHITLQEGRCSALAAAAAAKAQWKSMDTAHEVATLGIQAAWMLQRWDDMATFVQFWGDVKLHSTGCACACSKGRTNCPVCLAMAAARVHDEPFKLLLYHTALALAGRRGISSLFNAHDYLQAARFSFFENCHCLDSDKLFFLQRLEEMQEVVDYLAAPSNIARILLRRKWLRRVRWWAPPAPSLWPKLIMARNMALTPIESIETYILLARLCQDTGQQMGCLALMGGLLPLLSRKSSFCFELFFAAKHPNEHFLTDVRVEFIYQCRHSGRDNVDQRYYSIHYHACLLLWGAGNNQAAYRRLVSLSKILLDFPVLDNIMTNALLGCLSTRCEWCIALTHAAGNFAGHYNSLCESRALLTFALELGSCRPHIWFAWAFANYELSERICAAGPTLHQGQFVIESLDGLFRSICLFGASDVRYLSLLLQAMLMIITLWFKHGSEESVHCAMEYGLAKTSVGIWLGVVPQLVARLDHAESNARSLLTHLLSRISLVHPQALVYPLTIAGNSSESSRRKLSKSILCTMQHVASSQHHNQTVVAVAGLVALELHRAAATWHEVWFQGIETAANALFGDGSVDAMMRHLAALHSSWRCEISASSAGIGVDQKYHITRVLAFHHTYGCDIEESRRCLCRYRRAGNLEDFHQAWDLYSNLHRRLKSKLVSAGCENLKTSHVAPKLLSVHNLPLAVPGLNVGLSDECEFESDIVYIASFCSKIRIICSKQRPRRVQMHGSNGKTYDFLLKGNEDLRQDERVMQLCRLINCLLAKADSKFESLGSASMLLQVARYAVMPLSNKSGLIEWVSDCCTMHSLIVEHRHRFHIQIDAEQYLAEAIAPCYLQLQDVGKVEAFSGSLARTRGIDLLRMLWLGSSDLEKWLCKRHKFTSSLGLTSMVGYVIGLGDRHLSNIMLNNTRGDIVHIDFGDCFDVALERETFPEYVPFRLTRQLINAMETDGLHTRFCLVCNHAMKIMRGNYGSLTAMLETLVHDPLIGMALIENKQAGYTKDQNGLQVLDIIRNKLVGICTTACTDGRIAMIEHQVAGLIHQARNHENTCKMFFGWCPFW